MNSVGPRPPGLPALPTGRRPGAERDVLAPPAPSLRHLRELSGPLGLFEHAKGRQPRPERGYCTDDNGRALALACRLKADPYAEELAQLCLGFLERAHTGNGDFRLRLGPDGHWAPEPPSDDATGRALLGLGVAASAAPWQDVRERAAVLFAAVAGFRSPWPRAAAYGALGAAQVVQASLGAPLRLAGRRLLESAARVVPPSHTEGPARHRWPWPEPRLTYANALVPAASLAIGEALEREELIAGGLGQLAWLAEEESLDGHFSFVPVGGRGPGEAKPAWDQQPIEAAAMAYACSLALRISGQRRWEAFVRRALRWWLGHNDTGVLMWDPTSGGGYDGLLPDGVNSNEGAESTIAFVGAMTLAQAQAPSASSSPETEAVAAPT